MILVAFFGFRINFSDDILSLGYIITGRTPGGADNICY